MTKNKNTFNVICFNKELVSKIKKILPAFLAIEEIANTFSILRDKTRVKIVFRNSVNSYILCSGYLAYASVDLPGDFLRPGCVRLLMHVAPIHALLNNYFYF